MCCIDTRRRTRPNGHTSVLGGTSIDQYANTTTFLYDSYGRQTGVIQPTGARTTTVYDIYNNVTAQVDAYGMGVRVPMLVVSPWVKRGYVSGQLYEHASILKFIERRFGLRSLASMNHQFDTSTPTRYNDAAAGKTAGPPAPPRDGLTQIGNFLEVFDFSQNGDYHPKLPSAPVV